MGSFVFHVLRTETDCSRLGLTARNVNTVACSTIKWNYATPDAIFCLNIQEGSDYHDLKLHVLIPPRT